VPRADEFRSFVEEQRREEERKNNRGAKGRRKIEREAADKRAEIKARRKRMDTQIRVWSDYLTTPLHPKSVCEIEGFKHEIDAFDRWSNGSEIFSGGSGGSLSGQEKEEILDRFRYIVEECDRLQGLQCFSEVDNGFGGFAKGFLAECRDEFPKLPVLTFGITSNTRKQVTIRHMRLLFSPLIT
jgi:hypothetical protein